MIKNSQCLYFCISVKTSDVFWLSFFIFNLEHYIILHGVLLQKIVIFRSTAVKILNTLFETGIWYDIFVNCNWVVTRWQKYSTHLHTNNTQNDMKQTIHRATQQFWKSAGRAPSWLVISLAFALQPRKKQGKTSLRVAASKNAWTKISVHRQRYEYMDEQ